MIGLFVEVDCGVGMIIADYGSYKQIRLLVGETIIRREIIRVIGRKLHNADNNEAEARHAVHRD